jgi:hypothetical protein
MKFKSHFLFGAGVRIAKRNRQPRTHVASPVSHSWKAKLHPLFIGAAEYQKQVLRLLRSDSAADKQNASRLSVNLPPDLVRDAEALHDEMQASGKLRRRSSIKMYGLEDIPPGSTISEEHYVYHWLCWFKYNKTVKTLQAEYASGSFKAAKQFHQLNLEFDKWRLGLTDPNKMKFKTDLDHFDLITAGLNLGIETLTPTELADCFDALCPCGGPHFPENLSKLRKRICLAFPVEDSGTEASKD